MAEARTTMSTTLEELKVIFREHVGRHRHPRIPLFAFVGGLVLRRRFPHLLLVGERIDSRVHAIEHFGEVSALYALITSYVRLDLGCCESHVVEYCGSVAVV